VCTKLSKLTLFLFLLPRKLPVLQPIGLF